MISKSATEAKKKKYSSQLTWASICHQPSTKLQKNNN